MKKIKKDRAITIKIDEPTFEKFKQATEQEGVTMSFIIYQNIKNYIKKILEKGE